MKRFIILLAALLMITMIFISNRKATREGSAATGWIINSSRSESSPGQWKVVSTGKNNFGSTRYFCNATLTLKPPGGSIFPEAKQSVGDLKQGESVTVEWTVSVKDFPGGDVTWHGCAENKPC